jgi:hypothetical protein
MVPMPVRNQDVVRFEITGIDAGRRVILQEGVYQKIMVADLKPTAGVSKPG